MSNSSWVMEPTDYFIRSTKGKYSSILRRQIHRNEVFKKIDVVTDDSRKAEPLFCLHS